MPAIAEFLGMVIYIYAVEHPPPHFHVRFGDMWAAIDIRTGELIDGVLPRKKLKKIEEWRTLHRQELMQNWEAIIRHGAPQPIEPL